MAAKVMDAIMLLGDSLTQGGWHLDGFAARLARWFPSRDLRGEM